MKESQLAAEQVDPELYLFVAPKVPGGLLLIECYGFYVFPGRGCWAVPRTCQARLCANEYMFLNC